MLTAPWVSVFILMLKLIVQENNHFVYYFWNKNESPRTKKILNLCRLKKFFVNTEIDSKKWYMYFVFC